MLLEGGRDSSSVLKAGFVQDLYYLLHLLPVEDCNYYPTCSNSLPESWQLLIMCERSCYMQRNFSERITCEMHSSLEGLQQGCLSCGSLVLVFASGAGTLLILSVRICMGKEFLLLSQCFSPFVFFPLSVSQIWFCISFLQPASECTAQGNTKK